MTRAEMYALVAQAMREAYDTRGTVGDMEWMHNRCADKIARAFEAQHAGFDYGRFRRECREAPAPAHELSMRDLVVAHATEVGSDITVSRLRFCGVKHPFPKLEHVEEHRLEGLRRLLQADLDALETSAEQRLAAKEADRDG